MPRHQPLPPPTQVTRADVYRLGLGAIMIPLGVTILWRAASAGSLTTAALLVGLAFIGYGGHRLYVGLARYRMFRDAQRKTPRSTKDPGARRSGGCS